MAKNRVSALVAFATAVAIPAVALGAFSTAAEARGVNDVNDVVRYSSGRVIGDIVPGVSNTDDASVLVHAPWPMNFFGNKYDGLCVTSNGTVSPVVYDEADCSDDYDQNLADLAMDVKAPVIAAFANDNDTSNTVLDWESTVSNFSVDSGTGVVTITTSSAHGLSDGDVRSLYLQDSHIDNLNTDDLRTDDIWYQNVSVTVVDATHFTFSGSTAATSDGTEFTPDYTEFSGTTFAPSKGWVWDQSSPDQDGVDDGVGVVNSIYVGETTIGGRDAWVYTDYRSVTYEDDNPQILTNTFQIVLIKKATTAGTTDGFDFDIEYNYGSVMDGGDGYSVDNGNCSAMNVDCRTGVGLVNLDPRNFITDVYELFGSTPSRDLVDWFTSGMTHNRLNTDLNGRYTFAMVGGVVQNFAIPTMDGSGNTTPRPEPVDPLAPVADEAGISLGQSSLVEDGQPVDVTLERNTDNNGLIFSVGSDFQLTLAGDGASGNHLPLDNEGNLILASQGTLNTGGEGFLEESPVKLYAFSNPTYIGTLYTDVDGAFSGTLQMPAGLAPGVHNIQVIGFTPDGQKRILTIGVRVTPDGKYVLAETGVDASAIAIAGLALLAAGVVVVRRRRATAANA